MRTLLLLTTTGLLAGCQTHPLPLADLPLVEPSTDHIAAPRQPTLLRQYTVGARIDPDNDRIRHESHTVHRVELESRWNLAATAVEPELEVLAPAPSEALAKAETGAVPVPEPKAPPPDQVVERKGLVRGSEQARVPNADGLIDLTAVAAGTGDDVNPFAVRHLPAEAVREVTLNVHGIIGGDVPCALINERTFQVGEQVESFAVVRIEPESVLLRLDDQLIRLPVNPTPARVRFAL